MIEPIYIFREVDAFHRAALSDYARKIGLQNLVVDMHVTLAYSREPVEWDAPAFQMDPRPLIVSGGTRALRKFDGGAIVLELESRALTQRWSQFIMAGASWDYPDYRPHVTLAYDDAFNVEGVYGYPADIMFGGELRQWLDTGYVERTA